ncbi:MAG: hypothetical protein ACJ79L_08025 [Anaeromyxobacteraceae bacterium]
MLAAYVSGHGFGHLMRLCEVLRAVRARAPALPIALVGSVPGAVAAREVPPPFTSRHAQTDVGLAQQDALVIDEARTAEWCRAFDATWDARVAEEAAFLRASGARAVLGDIPPLAFAAAARAGIPSVALGNFSWDWIYRHLAAREPSLHAAADRAAEAYRAAALLLALPFAGPFSAFGRIEEVGFVARRPRIGRAEGRARLGLDGRPAVLVSFGGVGLPGLTRDAVGQDPAFQFLFPEELPQVRLDAAGLSYIDVVGAADVLVTKPGYGIVTDAIGAGTPIVYTERGDFPEYPIMVREMPRWLACEHVANDALRAGRITGAIRSVLGRPMPPPPDLGGAARAAERVLAVLG